MDQPIGDADLVPKLQAASQTTSTSAFMCEPPRSSPDGRVAQIMAAVTSAGFKKVALVTEPINQ